MPLLQQIFLYLSILTSVSEKKMRYAKCQISEKVRKSQNTGESEFCQGAGDGGDELAFADLLMSNYTHFEGCIKIADGSECSCDQ